MLPDSRSSPPSVLVLSCSANNPRSSIALHEYRTMYLEYLLLTRHLWPLLHFSLKTARWELGTGFCFTWTVESKEYHEREIVVQMPTWVCTAWATPIFASATDAESSSSR